MVVLTMTLTIEGMSVGEEGLDELDDGDGQVQILSSGLSYCAWLSHSFTSFIPDPAQTVHYETTLTRLSGR